MDETTIPNEQDQLLEMAWSALNQPDCLLFLEQIIRTTELARVAEQYDVPTLQSLKDSCENVESRVDSQQRISESSPERSDEEEGMEWGDFCRRAIQLAQESITTDKSKWDRFHLTVLFQGHKSLVLKGDVSSMLQKLDDFEHEAQVASLYVVFGGEILEAESPLHQSTLDQFFGKIKGDLKQLKKFLADTLVPLSEGHGKFDLEHVKTNTFGQCEADQFFNSEDLNQTKSLPLWLLAKAAAGNQCTLVSSLNSTDLIPSSGQLAL